MWWQKRRKRLAFVGIAAFGAITLLSAGADGMFASVAIFCVGGSPDTQQRRGVDEELESRPLNRLGGGRAQELVALHAAGGRHYR